MNLYVVFGVSPVAFCDNIETAREFVKKYEERHLEIREIPLNKEFNGMVTVPGETSQNDWMSMMEMYWGGSD